MVPAGLAGLRVHGERRFWVPSRRFWGALASLPAPPVREARLYRHHGHDRLADPDLVPLLQQLDGKDGAPVERGAVGGVEVFDVPQAANGHEAGVLAGSEIVVDNKAAFAADREVGAEGL